MATKNNPGDYDCYANAEPDEPMFILLGRDPIAEVLVMLWADIREALGGADPEKMAEARLCAEQLAAWARSKGKDPDNAKLATAGVFARIIQGDPTLAGGHPHG